jgi:hypothetical protein
MGITNVTNVTRRICKQLTKDGIAPSAATTFVSHASKHLLLLLPEKQIQCTQKKTTNIRVNLQKLILKDEAYKSIDGYEG